MSVLFIILVGLSLASFIGSLSYRTPRNISMVRPRSFCPVCRNTLKSYDLIPVLSYLFLRGRCRYCSCRIPVKYFIIELITPLIYFGVYKKFGAGFQFFIYSYLCTILLYLSLVDIDTGVVRIYDIVLVYLGSLAILYLSLLGKLSYPVLHYLYGSIFATILITISFLIIFIIKKRKPMGGGDLLIIPGVAFYFGVRSVIRIMIFSSSLGIFIGVILIFRGIVERNHKFPMIPYLLAGVLIELFFIL